MHDSPSRLLSFTCVTRLVAVLALCTAPFAHAQTAGAPLTLSAFAGQAGSSGSVDGTGSAARFLNPSGLAIDGAGNVYVADSGNNTIRKITAAGVVTTFAGRAVDPDTGLQNNGGTADGTGAAAEFSFGKAIIDSIGSNTIAIDPSGNLYVADTLNNSIRKVTSGAVVTTLTLKDGTGSSVTLNSPDGVAIDSAGNLYVTESGTNTIRRITPSGTVSVFAGTLNVSGSADGTGGSVTFSNPRGIAIDGAGNLYISDTNNNTIRKITAAGVVSTYAGSAGTPTKSSAGSSDGLARNARFNGPVGLAMDSSGNLYVADKGNQSIRKITPAGVVSTIAGLSGTAGTTDGTGNAARLRQPYSLTVDNAGNLYIADTKNHMIRKGVSASSPTLQLTAQPQIQIVNTGQIATFGVSASGSPSPTFQWLKNGVAISGATSATYSFSTALADDRTYYSAVVTSGTVSFTSSAAQLQVYPPSVTIPPVIILTQPADLTVSAGLGASLSVEAAGNATLSYQWQKGSTNIAGANSPDYNIASTLTSDAGTYQVIVTNGGSSTTSNSATLTVNPVSTIGVVITLQPVDRSANIGQSATFTVSATGTPTPTFQWQKNGSNISGATSNTYTIASVQASDAANYRVIVTNIAGSVTSTSVALGVSSPVAITAQPTAQVVTAGQPAAFAVTASGSPTPTFQWQKNGVDIAGANSSSLAIGAAQASDAASYRVVVTNIAGSVTSNAVTLTVNAAFVDPGRLINLSILAPLVAGEKMTMGTVLGGDGTSGTKALVARAAGPALTQLGVTGVLPDPSMRLNNTSASPAVVVANNEDWGGSAALANAFAQVGAFPYASAASKDAGLTQPTLAKGNYTIEVNDNSGGAGTVIAELYDATPNGTFTVATPRLINVSVLKTIAAGTTLTAGFVIGGTNNVKVLVRAIGPTLGVAPFNIGGVMADPKLELFNNATSIKINENNDWATPVAPLTSTAAQLTATFTSVGAFQLANPTTKDAVLVVTLAPGQYSARVSGADGGGGTAIVEVYEVP